MRCCTQTTNENGRKEAHDFRVAQAMDTVIINNLSVGQVGNNSEMPIRIRPHVGNERKRILGDVALHLGSRGQTRVHFGVLEVSHDSSDLYEPGPV